MSTLANFANAFKAIACPVHVYDYIFGTFPVMPVSTAGLTHGATSYFYAYDASEVIMQRTDSATGVIRAERVDLQEKGEYFKPGHRSFPPTDTVAIPAPAIIMTSSDMPYYGYRYYSPGLGRWVNRDPADGIYMRLSLMIQCVILTNSVNYRVGGDLFLENS